MPESSLEKLLRLTGGTTKAYVRTNQQGRKVAVRQYPTPHPKMVSWGSLKVGQRVVLSGVLYQVVAVNVKVTVTPAQAAATKKAQAAAAAKLKAQGPTAAQKAAMTKAGKAAAASKAAASTGAALPGSAASAATPAAVAAAKKIEHIRLKNLATGRTTVVGLAAGTAVQLG